MNMGLSDAERKKIYYRYKEKLRKADVTIVTDIERNNYYWFKFKAGQCYIVKKENEWLYNGTKRIDENIERYDLWKAIIEAIEKNWMHE